jgi:hypothetical protein
MNPEYNADALVRIARERMVVMEKEMDALVERLGVVREEHGKLYAIVKAYDDGNLIGETEVPTPQVKEAF